MCNRAKPAASQITMLIDRQLLPGILKEKIFGEITPTFPLSSGEREHPAAQRVPSPHGPRCSLSLQPPIELPQGWDAAASPLPCNSTCHKNAPRGAAPELSGSPGDACSLPCSFRGVSSFRGLVPLQENSPSTTVFPVPPKKTRWKSVCCPAWSARVGGWVDGESRAKRRG